MRNVYICSRYGRRAEMQQVAAELTALGYRVTASWLTETDARLTDDGVRCEGPEEALLMAAARDLMDIRRADTVIAFTEEPDSGFSRGGRDREIGYALGHCKQVVLVGPYQNLFDHLPWVWHFGTWDECRRMLAEDAERAAA